WAAPTAMVLAAAAQLALGSGFKPVFWGLVVLLSLAGLALPTPPAASRAGRLALGGALLGLLAAHGVRFGAAVLTPAGFWPDLVLLLVALGALASAGLAGRVSRRSAP